MYHNEHKAGLEEFNPALLKLDQKTDVGKNLIALRDYTHHFAVTYHKKESNDRTIYD